MSTAQTFEQRAQSAGAALRTAFYDGPVSSTTTYRSPGVEQVGPRRARGRAVLAAAAALAVVATAAVLSDGGTDERSLPPAVPAPEAVPSVAPSPPPVPAGKQRVELQGASLLVPAQWRTHLSTLRTVSVGLVRSREPGAPARDGLNLVVPAGVLGADGAVQPAPADLLAWLQQHDGVTTQVLGTTDVDGRRATLVLTRPTRSSQPLWCGSASPTQDLLACYSTGPVAALYALVPLGEQTLVVDLMEEDTSKGFTEPQLARWAADLRTLLATVDLPD